MIFYLHCVFFVIPFEKLCGLFFTTKERKEFFNNILFLTIAFINRLDTVYP